jgi:hypothetical protein
MTTKYDSDGNPLNDNRRSRSFDPLRRNVHVDPKENLFTSAMANSQLLAELISFYVDHDNGYLKVRRASDSPDLHLTWSWSIGPNAGTYVYVRTEYWRLLFGLELLRTKVLESEEGIRVPTADKYRGGQR